MSASLPIDGSTDGLGNRFIALGRGPIREALWDVTADGVSASAIEGEISLRLPTRHGTSVTGWTYEQAGQLIAECQAHVTVLRAIVNALRSAVSGDGPSG
jgi:hypothetical protein